MTNYSEAKPVRPMVVSFGKLRKGFPTTAKQKTLGETQG